MAVAVGKLKELPAALVIDERAIVANGDDLAGGAADEAKYHRSVDLDIDPRL